MNTAVGDLRPIKFRDVIKVWAIWVGSIAAMIAVLLLGSLSDGLPVFLDRILAPVAAVLGIIGLWLLFLRRGWSWRDLGFVPLTRRGWHLLWQIPVAMVLGLLATAVLAGAVLSLTPAGDGGDAAVAETGGAAVMIALVSYLVLGPLLEEIMLRRFTMGWLDQVLGQLTRRRWLVVGLSTLISSIIFAVLHVVPPVIIWTFFLGLGCAILTRWHRSLWAGFLLHLVVNAVASTTLITALFP